MNSQDDELSLVEIISFISRNWLYAVVPAVLFALAGYLYFESMPTEYEATATLVVAPAGREDSGRASLNAQAYQKLIESAAIKQDTVKNLSKDGAVTSASSFRTVTKILPAARAEDSSILEATAYGRTPAEAMKTANAWVKTFIDHVQKTVTSSTTLAGSVLQNQLKDAKEQLAKGEDERTEVITKLAKEFEDRQVALDNEVLASELKAATALAKYKAETASIMETLKAELNLTLLEKEIASLENTLERFRKEYAEAGPLLSTKKVELTALRKQLGQTPPTLVLRKTLGDDAIWNTVAGKPTAIDWDSLQKQALLSEIVNPAHESLLSRLADTEILAGTLGPRQEQLQGEIEKLTKQIQDLKTKFAKDSARLSVQESERENGFSKLTQSTQLEKRTAERKREEGLRILRENHDDQKLRMERSIAPKLAFALNLERDWNRIQQAKVRDELTDLRVGAAAVEPTGPVSKKAMLYAVAMGFAGVLLGLLIAIVLHVRRAEAKKAN